VPLPEFTEAGNLPPGVHRATLHEAVERFGAGSVRRRALALRMERMYNIARATGHLARFVVFGSFVTDKPEPNDVDVFLLMEDTFDATALDGEAVFLFDHLQAEAYFGCSVFWMTRRGALGGEDKAVGYWQITRERALRGIVEIIAELP
jgi:hypothetical protein